MKNIAIAFTIFTLLPIIAPLFAYFNITFISDPIYFIYQFFCHQRPWRSGHLYDYQIAVCMRDISMYIGLTTIAWLLTIRRIHPVSRNISLVLVILGLIPIGLNGGLQLIGELTNIANFTDNLNYETYNIARVITGAFAGLAVGWGSFSLMLPDSGLENKVLHLRENPSQIFKNLLLISVTTILSLCSLNVIWYVTSNKYKPSSIVVDLNQNYPGINYEISTNGLHGTTTSFKQRVVTEPVDIYCKRMQISRKFELDKYLLCK